MGCRLIVEPTESCRRYCKLHDGLLQIESKSPEFSACLTRKHAAIVLKYQVLQVIIPYFINQFLVIS